MFAAIVGASCGSGDSAASSWGGTGSGGPDGSVVDGNAARAETGSSADAPPSDARPQSDGPSASPGDANLGPAPPSTWVNVTSNLAGLASECGNLTRVSARPGSRLVIAGVAHGGLYGTTDGGTTWSALGTDAGSATIINRPSAIVYDPVHPEVFWESGIYNGGGVYKTTDNGVTFQGLGSIGHIDLVSVDFTDPNRQTLVAGGHEQTQTLYRSTDGGKGWTNVGMNLPSTSNFSSAPLAIDGKTHLVGCCGWGSGTCGVWRTTDGGATWMSTSTLSTTTAPLWATSGAIYWPLVWSSGMAKSADQGQSFTESYQGTIASPVELPDGRIAAVGHDHLVISSDGVSWSPIGDTLPYSPAGASYSAQTKTFFIWHNDCGNAVLPDAIMSAGFDYQTM
jgi:photosystem II stability/assembly factor-like uncharacterized protein